MNATARRAVVVGALILGLLVLFIVLHDWPPAPPPKRMR